MRRRDMYRARNNRRRAGCACALDETLSESLPEINRPRGLLQNCLWKGGLTEIGFWANPIARKSKHLAQQGRVQRAVGQVRTGCLGKKVACVRKFGTTFAQHMNSGPCCIGMVNRSCKVIPAGSFVVRYEPERLNTGWNRNRLGTNV